MTIRNAIFNCLTAVTVLACLVQFAIGPSIENVAASCIVVASALTMIFYLRGTSALERHPLSSIAILGFCVTTQLGALLVQSAALTPLAGNLYTPLYTFGMLASYQAIALSMHVVYRFFSDDKAISNDKAASVDRAPPVGTAAKPRFIRGFLEWAGIYRTPSCGTLWYMGCVGLPTMLFWKSEGVLGKIAMGFNFLAWAPYLIPIYATEIGESYCNVRLNRILLAGYTGIFAVLGLAINARGIIFAGIATVGLLYVLRALRSDAPLTGRTLKRIGILALVLLAISGPLSDLTTSMVIARQMRGKVPPVVMIRTTLRILRQPGVLAAYKADHQMASRFSAYDEHYIANPMLGRLVETKFYDSAFHFASTLRTDEVRSRLRDVSVKLMWASLPTPVLHAIGVNIDKDDLDFSMGDYMAYLSRGVPLGGRKTGNMFAQGMVLFGPLFPFMYAAICLCLYGLMDLLTIRPAKGAARLSAVGMLEIWSFFMGGITFESMQKVFLLFVRGFGQTLLIYTLMLTPARLMRRERSANPPSNLAMWQRPT